MLGSDQHWMAEALRQARKGLYSTPPNPSVGCVIVSNNEMISTGWHELTGGPHAEVNAISSTEIPEAADFYVTLEPCSHHGRTPPCVEAVMAAKPSRVIVAMQDPNPKVSGRGLEMLRAADIEVKCGVLEAEARSLNRGFVKRMEQGLPFVSVKMASSLDGGTALKNGISQWITGDAARQDVQFLRARSSAILSSAQTVLDDDPSLNLRLDVTDLEQNCAVRHPVRVIVDSQLRLDGNEKIFSTLGEIWIVTLSQDEARQENLRALGATVIQAESTSRDKVNLASMLRDLAERGINEIHCECGQHLAGALIDQSLVDQIQLYLAPHLLGSAARGVFDLGELDSMEQRKNCKITDLRQFDQDLRLTLELNSGVC